MHISFRTGLVLLTLVFLTFSCKATYSQNSNNADKNIGQPVVDANKFANLAELQGNLHSIAKNETSSVVYIGIEKTVSQQQMDPFEYFFGSPDPFSDKRGGQQPKERQFKQQGLGSGVIYAKKGNDYFVVTNNHVIEGADKITIVVDQKKKYDGKVIGSDTDVDIAVVKITTKDELNIAKFGDSGKLQTGDFVIAIGNPFGLSGTMTFGIISAIGRSDVTAGDKPSLTDFIQTDAAINPGNSGGALLNINGEVIGINTMIVSQSGGNVGIGFAVPINIAKKIADELITTGKKKIDHGYLGVQFESLTEESAKTLDLKNITSGMLVREVVSGSPADKAGIKTGDVLIEINGKALNNTNDLTMTVGNSSPGTKLNFKLVRDGQTITKDVVLGNRNEMGAQADNSKPTSIDEYGLNVSELNSSLKDKYDIPSNVTGVIITGIERGSRSEQSGLQVGDVIFKVNNKKIAKVDDLNKILKDNKNNNNYLYVFRGGREILIMM
jgi:serine protease Do